MILHYKMSMREALQELQDEIKKNGEVKLKRKHIKMLSRIYNQDIQYCRSVLNTANELADKMLLDSIPLCTCNYCNDIVQFKNYIAKQKEYVGQDK